MTYEKKKQNLSEKGKEILKLYSSLLHEILEYTTKFNEMTQMTLTPDEQFDLLNLFVAEKQNLMIQRLSSSIMYVGEPTDEKIISLLLKNIEFNNPDKKIVFELKDKTESIENTEGSNSDIKVK